MGNPNVTITLTEPKVTVVDQTIEIVEIGRQGLTGPTGASGFSANVSGETPAGAVNGANATFSTAFPFVPESVNVTVNGIRIKRVDEFNTSGNQTIILAVSPGVGEVVLVDYTKQ